MIKKLHRHCSCVGWKEAHLTCSTHPYYNEPWVLQQISEKHGYYGNHKFTIVLLQSTLVFVLIIQLLINPQQKNMFTLIKARVMLIRAVTDLK